MAHDANGTLLAEGDVVHIPCRVKTISTGEDFCNVTLESLYGRRPDGSKETISSINTGVVVKIQPEDARDTCRRSP